MNQEESDMPHPFLEGTRVEKEGSVLAGGGATATEIEDMDMNLTVTKAFDQNWIGGLEWTSVGVMCKTTIVPLNRTSVGHAC